MEDAENNQIISQIYNYRMERLLCKDKGSNFEPHNPCYTLQFFVYNDYRSFLKSKEPLRSWKVLISGSGNI